MCIPERTLFSMLSHGDYVCTGTSSCHFCKMDVAKRRHPVRAFLWYEIACGSPAMAAFILLVAGLSLAFLLTGSR